MASTSGDWSSEDSYALVRNIPSAFRSRHLRRYFGSFVEAGRFLCFHFRHRPESRLAKLPAEDAEKGASEPATRPKAREAKSCCALVKLSAGHRENFVAEFHGKRWIAPNDASLNVRCFVVPIKAPLPKDPAQASGSAEEKKEDMLSMPELNPPSLMPQGNVGTPTAHFKDAIQRCTLPPSVIRQLGLNLAAEQGSRLNPAYNRARLDYDDGGEAGERLGPATGEEGIEEAILRRIAPPDPDDADGDDDDDAHVEEWERHEAREDDPGTQGRHKPLLLEQEEEMVWEKGGPGLVWYTDDFAWAEMEGKDSDELWADDWDVDMEPYYSKDPGAGDRDARDHALLRLERAREAGEDLSVFRKPHDRKRPAKDDWDQPSSSRPRSPSPEPFAKKSSSAPSFASFERHSKGIGGKLLRASGWVEGGGLGARGSGALEPVAVRVERDGRRGRERRGLGRKVVDVGIRFGALDYRLRRAEEAGRISSTADAPDERVAGDRRAEPERMKTYDWKAYSKADPKPQ